MNSISQCLRVARRFARAALGKEVWQTRQLRTGTCTLGNRNAAWTICRFTLPSDSVIYSLGVGEDISFDLEMVRRFGVTVHAFDPTPKSIAWINTLSLPAGFVFHPFAVGAVDGVCRLFPPRDPRHTSHTVVPRSTPWSAIEVPTYRIPTIARMLGHKRIDVLKMDIEGAEYDVINDLLNSEIAVGQLLVEFHHRWHEVGIARTKNAIRDLNAAGYRIFSVSGSGEEYGFIKASAD